MLDGYRGRPVADLDHLAEVLVAIGNAAIAFGPKLAALEINPLWVCGEEIEALDALVVWQE